MGQGANTPLSVFTAGLHDLRRNWGWYRYAGPGNSGLDPVAGLRAVDYRFIYRHRSDCRRVVTGNAVVCRATASRGSRVRREQTVLALSREGSALRSSSQSRTRGSDGVAR
jgi:hypothetical protein